MDELIKQLSTVARGMWMYRRVAMAVAWVVALAMAAFVFLMQDRYEASARVHVDTESILRPLMSGLAVQPNVEQQVQMLSRTLISRPTIERLIRNADLDLSIKTKAERDALIDQVTKEIQVRTTGRDNLYTLSYRDTSPERAQRVVQALVTIFVESSLGASRTDTDSARRFLDEQIKSYENKLSEAETRLKEFKLRNIELQGETDSAGQIAQLTAQLSEASLQLREAESAREAARRQIDQARGALTRVSDGGSSIATPEIDSRLDAQKRQLDALLQRFTEQHPDVLNTRRLIKELEDQKKREQEEKRVAAAKQPSALLESSPALQELSRTMATAEVQVAGLRARVGEYNARLAQAQARLKLAPQLETELAQLNRDYEIHQKNYNDLVSRRESANLSSELETASNVADFRVIDPPRAGNKPAAPNRALLMPGALIVGLAAGMGVAFLLSQIRPVFFDAASLRQVSGMPLLGVVSLVVNDARRRIERRSLFRFLLALAALVILFVGLVAYLVFRTGFSG
ncbi:chain length-determining protein [Aquabacterium lacunae]|uniref:Chain length-determining protein n=1 Tax=Aquabacterium lacunae TaxID=2528630 RepID=A0A4V2JFK2_9BURK|nr:XrtA system polysaccharide chain length determinant [Aquabacterium lacunae]TBO30250.1 chain length-determining protein [Aquabacterium lacunae]